MLFGCSDSRVAAEIIFDQGLGDLFVVRTAGHVLDTTVIGSIEYGVSVLGAPLVVVLGHDSCGAVAAATAALTDRRASRPGSCAPIVDRVIPSIVSLVGSGQDARTIDAAALGHEHVRHTVQMLQGYSVSLAEAVAEGRLRDHRARVHARRRHGPAHRVGRDRLRLREPGVGRPGQRAGSSSCPVSRSRQ